MIERIVNRMGSSHSRSNQREGETGGLSLPVRNPYATSLIKNEFSQPMNISDLQTGYQIIARLSLADAPLAQIEINRFLDSLLQAPPSADVYLQLLEQIRNPIAFVEEELAKGYLNKPLPLGTIEEERFVQSIATWRKVVRAYAHCARVQGRETQGAEGDRLALILQRCIYATGMIVHAHWRARRELPTGVWLDLHGYYASAEEWGVAAQTVPDSLDTASRRATCAGTYVSILLLDLAEPYGLSIPDLALVWRWAALWAPLVAIEAFAVDEKLPVFALDLMRDCAIGPLSESSAQENLRKIDTSRLMKLLRQAKAQLPKKISPAELGLGSDCPPGKCQRLLQRIAKPWSLSRAARNFRRHKTTLGEQVKICTGLPAIHFFVSGKEFTQPETANLYSRNEFESLFAFRHLNDPTQQLEFRQAQLGYTLERWETVDESAGGFRLLRSSKCRRIEIGQLLSILPTDSCAHLLAQVAWLMQEKSGALQVGVAVFPGKPQAVAVRPVAHSSATSVTFERAFVLPEIASLGVEQTLILPAGWYHPQRQLDLHSDRVGRICLGSLIAEGPDFTRAIFTAV